MQRFENSFTFLFWHLHWLPPEKEKKKKSPLLELLKTISKLSIYFSGQTLGDLNICPEKKTDESVAPSKSYHLIAQMSVSFHNLLKVQWNKAEVLATQLCLTPRDLMDCRPPGSSVHEILQARILECVAVLFSRDLSNPEIEPGCPILQAGFFYCLSHQGSYLIKTKRSLDANAEGLSTITFCL